jgi:hypothetical protein
VTGAVTVADHQMRADIAVPMADFFDTHVR